LVLARIQKEVTMEHIHSFSKALSSLTEIILNLHLLAILIVNVTKSPKDEVSELGSYTSVNRLYRIIEFLAGFITPLAKK
jgi:hypothetical protein